MMINEDDTTQKQNTIMHILFSEYFKKFDICRLFVSAADPYVYSMHGTHIPWMHTLSRILAKGDPARYE